VLQEVWVILEPAAETLAGTEFHQSTGVVGPIALCGACLSFEGLVDTVQKALDKSGIVADDVRHRLRMWQQRENNTFRPFSLLASPKGWERFLGCKTHAQAPSFSVYLCSTAQQSEPAYLLLKKYDAATKQLTWMGAVQADTNISVAQFTRSVLGKNEDPRQWALLEEVNCATNRLHLMDLTSNQTMSSFGFRDGDVLCFQKHAALPASGSVPATAALEALKGVHQEEAKMWPAEAKLRGLPKIRYEACTRPMTNLQRVVAPPSQADWLPQFMNSPQFADVVFVAQEQPDKQLFAHKVVLCRLEYFARMFNSGFAEGQSHSGSSFSSAAATATRAQAGDGKGAQDNSLSAPSAAESKLTRIEIPLAEMDTLQLLLRYAYGTTLNVEQERDKGGDVEFLSQLVFLGDKYLVPAIYSQAVQQLEVGLKEDNCLEVLQLAERFHEEKLKAATLSFIREHIDAVCSQPQFDQLCETSPQLVRQIVLACKKRRSRSRSPRRM